jgi:hypothetical protein
MDLSSLIAECGLWRILPTQDGVLCLRRGGRETEARVSSSGGSQRFAFSPMHVGKVAHLERTN